MSTDGYTKSKVIVFVSFKYLLRRKNPLVKRLQEIYLYPVTNLCLAIVRNAAVQNPRNLFFCS